MRSIDTSKSAEDARIKVCKEALSVKQVALEPPREREQEKKVMILTNRILFDICVITKNREAARL